MASPSDNMYDNLEDEESRSVEESEMGSELEDFIVPDNAYARGDLSKTDKELESLTNQTEIAATKAGLVSQHAGETLASGRDPTGSQFTFFNTSDEGQVLGGERSGQRKRIQQKETGVKEAKREVLDGGTIQVLSGKSVRGRQERGRKDAEGEGTSDRLFREIPQSTAGDIKETPVFRPRTSVLERVYDSTSEAGTHLSLWDLDNTRVQQVSASLRSDQLVNTRLTRGAVTRAGSSIREEKKEMQGGPFKPSTSTPPESRSDAEGPREEVESDVSGWGGFWEDEDDRVEPKRVDPKFGVSVEKDLEILEGDHTRVLFAMAPLRDELQRIGSAKDAVLNNAPDRERDSIRRTDTLRALSELGTGIALVLKGDQLTGCNIGGGDLLNQCMKTVDRAKSLILVAQSEPDWTRFSARETFNLMECLSPHLDEFVIAMRLAGKEDFIDPIVEHHYQLV